jgi:hypothetical protein
MKTFIKRNFAEMYLVEMEYKYIHLDCLLITCFFGVIFGLIVGPWLEIYHPEMIVLRLIGFTFAFSSLFWAWRIAAFLRKEYKKHSIKYQVRKSYKKGRDD